jgi:hypothetical protein
MATALQICDWSAQSQNMPSQVCQLTNTSIAYTGYQGACLTMTRSRLTELLCTRLQAPVRKTTGVGTGKTPSNCWKVLPQSIAAIENRPRVVHLQRRFQSHTFIAQYTIMIYPDVLPCTLSNQASNKAHPLKQSKICRGMAESLIRLKYLR